MHDPTTWRFNVKPLLNVISISTRFLLLIRTIIYSFQKAGLFCLDKRNHQGLGFSNEMESEIFRSIPK